MILLLTALEYTWVRDALKVAPPMLSNDPNADNDEARKDMLRSMSNRKVVNTGFLGRKKMISFDVYPPDCFPISSAAHWYAENGPLRPAEASMLHKAASRILNTICNNKEPVYIDGYNRIPPKPNKLSERER